MHMLVLVVTGLILLAVCITAATALNRKRSQPINGARVFIWVWLVIALINGWTGVVRAGIPLINEIGAFIVIFGVPAAAAWYWSWRRRRAEPV